MPIERVTTEAIKRYLERRGAWVFRVVPTGRGRRGVPDLLACYRGIFVGLEVKRADVAPSASAPTAFQRLELEAIRRSGGLSAVARSVDDASEILDKIDDLGPPLGLTEVLTYASETT